MHDRPLHNRVVPELGSHARWGPDIARPRKLKGKLIHAGFCPTFRLGAEIRSQGRAHVGAALFRGTVHDRGRSRS